MIIYDGKNGTSPISKSLTGNLTPILTYPIVSTGNNIYIEFMSDNDGDRKGFNASISTMKKDPICQLSLDYLNLKLKSPNFNKECNWLITAQTGQHVILKFSTLDVSLCFTISAVIIVYFLLFSLKKMLSTSHCMMVLVKNLQSFII